MARIRYDEQTAAAYKAVREVAHDGRDEWRDAVRRHLRPARGMTIVDVGAGTGAFAAAFTGWFGIDVLAVEPSDAMRSRIPRTSAITVLAGDAAALPLPDASADAAWLSLVLHHVADLEAAAHELRRVLRPGAPILIRQGFHDRYEPVGYLRWDSIEIVRWFPETARVVKTFPSLAVTRAAFARAGFREAAIEQVRETNPLDLADFLEQLDTFRAADTTMRTLTDDEFERGRERVRAAVQSGRREPRSNWLDLLVLR